MNRSFLLTAVMLTLSIAISGQEYFSSKRVITKTDKFEFRSGGTVAITGAPKGSIKVIGSQLNEIEIIAEIELYGATEPDLNTLATLTGFVTDESAARTGIISVGSHNKFGQKKLPKNFPKSLVAAPYTINYVVRIPRYSDLEIDGGVGDLAISGVEGSIRANFLETDAKVEVVGGSTSITIGKGSADVSFGIGGWRGRSANIQIANGDLTVRLPTTLSAEVDAVILKTGTIENNFPDLRPRDRKVVFSERSILAKAGVGGVSLKFVVGDGKLKLEPLRKPI